MIPRAKFTACIVALALFLFTGTIRAEEPIKPRIIPLDFAVSEDGSGSLLAADVDGDGVREFVVTARGHLGVYRTDGKQVWHREMNIFFSGKRSGSLLPGLHAPGIQVADVDAVVEVDDVLVEHADAAV